MQRLDDWQVNSPPAIASKYLRSLESLLRYHVITEIGIWARISERGSQKSRKNYRDQINRMRHDTKSLGLNMTKAFWHIGPGWDLDNDDLKQAIAWAKVKSSRILLAESTDRCGLLPES